MNIIDDVINDVKSVEPPVQLKQHNRWIVWDTGPVMATSGKPQKMPKHPVTGKTHSAHDPEIHMSYEDALAVQKERGYAGIGFVLSRELGITCLDLADDGIIDATIELIMSFFPKTYIELSPSGGVHIWILGVKTEGAKKDWFYEGKKIEVYSDHQYITWTGKRISDGAELEDMQGALDELCDYLVDKGCIEKEEKDIDVEFATRVTAELTLDDEQLLTKARNNVVTGPTFIKLNDRGDIAGYPSQSEADLNLMEIFAYWTQKDAARMERLFSGSALGQRNKWIKRADYRADRVRQGIARCKKVYDQGYRSTGVPHATDTKVTNAGVPHDVLQEKQVYSTGDSKGVPHEGFDYESDYRVYTYMVANGVPHGENGLFKESQRAMADALGLSTRTVRKAIKRLIKQGYILRNERDSIFEAFSFVVFSISKSLVVSPSNSYIKEDKHNIINNIIDIDSVGDKEESKDINPPNCPYPISLEQDSPLPEAERKEKMERSKRRLTMEEVEPLRALVRDGLTHKQARWVIVDGEVAQGNIYRKAILYVQENHGDDAVLEAFGDVDLINDAWTELDDREFKEFLWQLIRETLITESELVAA